MSNPIERAELLHGIRWNRKVQDEVLVRVGNLPPKAILVGIMDAVFKIESALGSYGSNAGRAFLSHALDDLVRLLEAPIVVAEADVIDVPQEE